MHIVIQREIAVIGLRPLIRIMIASVFEHVLTMRRQKAGVRTQCRIEGFDGFAVRTKQPIKAFAVVDLAGD